MDNIANPYVPGEITKRAFVNYSPWQEALWEATSDVAYSVLGGYNHTRMPTPGNNISLSGFEAWRLKVITAWATEANRDINTRGIALEDISDYQWLHWYERMLAAAPLKSILKSSTINYYDE